MRLFPGNSQRSSADDPVEDPGFVPSGAVAPVAFSRNGSPCGAEGTTAPDGAVELSAGAEGWVGMKITCPTFSPAFSRSRFLFES